MVDARTLETPLPRAVRLALPALVLGAVALGMSGIYVKLSETGPIATAFYRLALAAPAFLLILPLDGRRQAETPPVTRMSGRDGLLLAGAGVFFAGDMGTYHLALQYTNVANATLLANMAAVFVTAVAWLLFGERVTARFLLGMVLALAGAAILMGDSLSFRPEQAGGDALALLAACFYTAYLISMSRLRSRFSTIRIMMWTSAAGAVALSPFLLVLDETIVAVTWFGWLMLAALALGSHVMGQGLVAYALAHLPASFSAVALLIQPVAAAAFAWIILNEALGPLQAAGGAAVLFGIVLARMASRQRRQA